MGQLAGPVGVVAPGPPPPAGVDAAGRQALRAKLAERGEAVRELAPVLKQQQPAPLPTVAPRLLDLEGLDQGPAKCQRTALRRHASGREGGRAAGKPAPAPRALARARSATFRPRATGTRPSRSSGSRPPGAPPRQPAATL